MKKCSKCLEEKALEGFYNKRGSHICKECKKVATREWKRAYPGYHRKNILMKQYGLSLEQYDRMREQQGFCCYICREPEENNQYGQLDVDHCHSSGKVRALLCSKCNTGLGLFRDSPELLNAAVEYLKEHRR